MSLKSEINSAIASHSLWKVRLERAIETGAVDTPIEVIAADNQCYFGKWLYGASITPAIRNSEEYKRIVDLHAKFHLTAAKVVELVSSGKKAEAASLMKSSGEYTVITTKLVAELEAWAGKV